MPCSFTSPREKIKKLKLDPIVYFCFDIYQNNLKKWSLTVLESRYRKEYEKWFVQPLLTRRWILKKPPLVITALSCLTGILVLPFLVQERYLIALFFLILSGYLDTLDGAIARRTVRATPLGSLCDTLSDRLVEFCVIFGLFAQNPEERGYFAIGMLGSILLNTVSSLMSGSSAHHKTEKGFRSIKGLIERPEILLFFGAMILFPSLFSLLSAVFIALMLWTMATRLKTFS